MIKKALILFASALCLVSCDFRHSEENNLMTVFGTIQGNKDKGYTIYRDGGGIITPITSSVTSAAGEETEITKLSSRAVLYISYLSENIKDLGNDTFNLDGVHVQGGVIMPVVKPMTLEEAAKAKVTVADSVFKVNRFSGIWGYRGYMTTIINANVFRGNGAKTPSFNLIYNPEQNKENELDLTLVYNRHCSQEAEVSGSVDFYFSYDISSLAKLPAGRDSVKINVNIAGAETQTFKIGREDFSASNYVPFSGKTK